MIVFGVKAQDKPIVTQGNPSVFHNVDTHGYIFYIQKIGKINLDKDTIHLHVRFDSSNHNCSPYVGYGWCLPFLEASFVQHSDNLYIMKEPDGTIRLFMRDKKNYNLLWARNGWKAIIKNDRIVVTSESQVNLLFKNGKLIKMTTPRIDLSYQYEGEIVKYVRNKGQKIVEVVTSKDRQTIIHLTNKRKIILNMVSRPVYIAGKLTSSADSLGEIETVAGNRIRFQYLDDSSGYPSMQCAEGIFSWSPYNYLAKRVNHWRYDITPATSKTNYAGISRNNDHGNREYWCKDQSTGKITMEFYGVTRNEYYFVSGRLKGKIRRKEEICNGEITNSYDYFYNEKAQLVRLRSKNNADIFYVYEVDGRLAATIQNGKIRKAFTDNAIKLSEPYLR